MRSKKQLIILILKILETDTDENNPITQTKISEIISDKIPCDRKTVCRNIKFLKEMGYPIKKTASGFYMDSKKFSLKEIEFVSEAIRSAQGLSEDDKNDLSVRVVNTLYKHYIF